MTTPVAYAGFLVGALVSLGTSWVLVSRIERLGYRLGASEALLGLVAALAADTPEVTSAVSALASHQASVGAGVVIGSNVFNLAALLGLGAIVAGRIALHRRAVVLQGVVALWIASATLLTVVGVLSAPVGLAVVLAVLVPYGVSTAVEGAPLSPEAGRLRTAVARWLSAAIAEEEIELSGAIHPRRGGRVDVVVAVVSLAVVVAASVEMERAATTLGGRFAVPGIVVGGVALAAVTSLPNAVAAIYLARRGRGAATLSTGLGSNALNVAAGLMVPGTILGLGARSGSEVVTAGWYLGLTAVVVAFAYRGNGLRRVAGWTIVAAYVAYVVVLVLGA